MKNSAFNHAIGVPRWLRQTLLVMRITTLILLAALLQVSASSLAQKITIDKKNASIQTILNEISKQSGYDFFYDANALKKIKPISIAIKNADLDNAVKKSLEGLPLSYSIDNKTVVIKEAAPSLLDKLSAVISNIVRDLNVKGRVVDQDGKPLPNASIRVRGKGAVINTNAKGEFEIKGVEEDAVLLISYVGYKTLELPLKDVVMPLEIKLNMATGELEEVNVVYDDGYQKLNKERSTGSFVYIDNELFNRTVGTNVLDRILNVTSGLISEPRPGTASGTGISRSTGIVIRGFSTIGASMEPLVIVDNFPYEGDLNNLNPNDIESITVLKDAAATSIWGARAGNGVIVITSKKGRYNQVNSVSFKTDLNIGQKPDLFYVPYLSSKDMIEFEKQQFSTGIYNAYDDQFPSIGNFPVLPQSIEILLAARRKNKGIAGYNALNDPTVNAELDNLGNYDVRNDINKYILKNSLNQQYALNLSGGAGTFNYYTSLGYDKNKGQNLHEESSRLSLNFNNSWSPLKNLEISSSIVYTRTQNTPISISYERLVPGIGVSLYTRFADDQGNPLRVTQMLRSAYVDTASYPGLLDWNYKPLEDYHYVNANNKGNDTRLSGMVRYSIMPWIKAEFQFQNQFSLSDNKTQYGQESYMVRNGVNRFMTLDAAGKKVYPWPLGDYIEMRNDEFKAWNVRGSLRFDKKFGGHGVSAFGGIELRETNREITSDNLYGFDPETYLSINVNPLQSYPARPRGTGTIPIRNNVSGYLTRNGSYFANAAYNYKGKYLVTTSGRIDQSNFFGVKANLRRVPLWHIGLAWNLHQEDFYNIKWLSLLKLKASYGYTGNTNSGASSYATMRYLSSATGEGVPSRNISFGEIRTPNNPELRWERVKIINLGLDFAIKNRISGSLDIYKKNGLDLLGPIIKEGTTGVNQVTGNQASILAKGFDLTLSTQNIIESKFEWHTNLLVSFNKDKVVAYGGSQATPSSLISGAIPNIGDPLYSIYAYRSAGLDPKTGDPRVYLNDTISTFSNQSKAKKEDLLFYGSVNPKIFGSFRNAISWHQITLSANITYRFGNYFRRNSIDYNQLLTSGWSAHSDYGLRWQKPGDELKTDVPSLPIAGNSSRDAAYRSSNSLVEKGDAIRLQDIRIEYNLNKNIFKKLPFKQVSIYVYAANLGIIWRANKFGLDPDAYTFGSMPKPRTVAFGLNANF